MLQMWLTKSSTATTDSEHSNTNTVAEEITILSATHAQNREITIEIANVAEELTVSSATFYYIHFTSSFYISPHFSFSLNCFSLF